MSDASVTAGARMVREMAEQPAVLRALIDRRDDLAATVKALRVRDLRGIVLIARGTSDHAAVYGRYVLEATSGVPVSLAAPSLWTRYERPSRLDGHLAVALSQSGRTPEIVQALRHAARSGASTLAITNDARSSLAAAADAVLELGVGDELAVPATKTFTAQLFALAAVADALSGARRHAGDLRGLPEAQQRILDDEIAPELVGELAGARAIVQIGSGYLYAIALEGALKLVETSSLPVLAYSANDFLHGPVAVAAPDVPVVCFGTAGPVRADVAQAARAAADRGAPIWWIGDVDGPAGAGRVPVPAAPGEALSPLLHALRAQQLAYGVSRALGRDPDLPAGLQKITPT